MKWLEIKMQTDPEAEEIVTALFLEAGAQGVSVNGAKMDEPAPWDYLGPDSLPVVPFSISAWFSEESGARVLEEVRQRAEQVKAMALDVPLGSMEATASVVDETDWESAWKAYFKPIEVSDHVVIRPTWEEYQPSDGELVISIDPGMAFGTGSHETTRMCVRLLEEYVLEGSDVVDAGCGSGVLAIAAALMGAERVYALDLDPVAVSVAKENVRINGCADVVKTMQSDLLAGLPAGVKADIVVANIIADVVIRLTEDVKPVLKRNGMFLCSGIIETRLDDVTAALEGNGFRVIEIQEDGEWRAVAAKYKP